MMSILSAAAVACVVVLLTGPVVIPVLHRLKFGQSIREEGPRRHFKKAGTPTMGGVLLLAAISLAALCFAPNNWMVWLALFVTLGHGVLGFIDDYIKVVLRRNLGLKARQKLLGQVLMAVALAYVTAHFIGLGTDVWLPFTSIYLDLGYVYYLLILLLLVGTTNAVNLTDGLDGLAAGTSLVAAATYTAVAYYLGLHELAVFCAAVAGACLGFLRYNYYPARIFMGDTGSLALGGALAAAAVITKTELLLVVIGGIFVVEALSVIIQVISFQTTGRRVFRMSPLHHHFELGGWPEPKVVATFWLVGAVCGLLGLAALWLRFPGGI